MRIPLLIDRQRRVKKALWVEKNYSSNKLIIPIGCDCHPAYLLRALNLRSISLPFDWINTQPLDGLDYVLENINNRFHDFLLDLSYNERGHIIAKRYPYAEFFHEKKLISDEATRTKVTRRANRFIDTYRSDAYFIYSLPVIGFDSTEKVDRMIASIKRFTSLLGDNQSLHIYLRYENSENENIIYWPEFYENASQLDKVFIGKFNKNQSKYGVWGDPNKFAKILQDLNIDIVRKFPRISIK